MFNNPFLKKDSLLEAVKAAQAEGDMRRAAEAIVNEEFGVYSRKAVVREQLAAYDAALETAYNQLKEGWEGSKEDKDEDKKLAKKHGMTMKQWEKSDADKKHDAKEKKMEEAKLADKDYDKDGKIESPKDEVWGSRLRAAKLAGKLKEGKKWEEEVDYSAPDRAAVTKDNKPVVSPTAPKADTSGPSASDKAALSSKIQSLKEAASRKDFRAVADLIKGHESQDKRNELASHHAGIFAKQNPRFDHAKFHAAAGSTAHQEPKKMEEAAYSAKAARAGKDIGKPGKSFEKIAKKAGAKYGSEEKGKKVAGAILAKIRAKHMKEEQSF